MAYKPTPEMLGLQQALTDGAVKIYGQIKDRASPVWTKPLALECLRATAAWMVEIADAIEAVTDGTWDAQTAADLGGALSNVVAFQARNWLSERRREAKGRA